MKKTIKERFYEKVGLDWQWIEYKNNNGYGRMKINNKFIGAHRISYLIHNGEIPDGMCVLHSCDDPGCVNPEHLHLGTQADNARERKERNRNADTRGEKHGMSKLTEQQVVEIRKIRESGETLVNIAKKYGVGKSIISYIAHRNNWKHIQ